MPRARAGPSPKEETTTTKDYPNSRSCWWHKGHMWPPKRHTIFNQRKSPARAGQVSPVAQKRGPSSDLMSGVKCFTSRKQKCRRSRGDPVKPGGRPTRLRVGVDRPPRQGTADEKAPPKRGQVVSYNMLVHNMLPAESRRAQPIPPPRPCARRPLVRLNRDREFPSWTDTFP